MTVTSNPNNISPYQPTERLENKIAVIVGGAGAIGAETARLLASKGARIAIVHRSNEPTRTDAILKKPPGHWP
jgi:3-oxoacyl-[acyl-carrier protein] reductase